MTRRRPIVVLGMMSKHPVPGVVWQTLHYLAGFERLGFESYYVEAGGHQPSAMLVAGDDGGTWDRSVRAAQFLDGVMRRIDMGDRWAFQALHADRRCYGLSETRLEALWAEAELVINLHGGTTPRAEHAAAGRLVYLETDPVQLQLELHRRRPATLAFLEPHAAFFTFGENYGRPRCRLPVTEGISFKPTRQPVVQSFWYDGSPPGGQFTTVGNWEQRGRPVRFRREVYHWSKHFEFMKVLELPARAGQAFELALSPTSLNAQDAGLLAAHGWRVRDAFELSGDLDAYRDYVRRSRGEFTVAKDQNIRFRTGWFSDRSACYLAAGRPVVTQETGFSDVLPTGAGLFAFSTLEEAAAAILEIAADPDRHARAAAHVARDYFDHAVVLRALLSDAGAALHGRRPGAFPVQAHPDGAAIDRLQDEILAAREVIRDRRRTYERQRDAGGAQSARPHREALNQARARLRSLQDQLERLEDSQDEAGASSAVVSQGGMADGA
jgi:hypothetical protein